MASKTWVLETGTKGTGANVVPLEKVLEKPEPQIAPGRANRFLGAKATHLQSVHSARGGADSRSRERRPLCHRGRSASGPRATSAVQAVDAKAGTATVRWLKRVDVSTVPLSAVTRR